MSEHNSEYYQVQFAERRIREVNDYRDEVCWKAGHRIGCPCKSGGEVILRPGWVSMELDGQTVEVEVAP
jgi:hypothetical protein